jgi:hypothetical protein
VQVLLATFRTQLRLTLGALSTWGFLALGMLLTAWGTLLDVLAVGIDAGRPYAIGHASGVMGGILLGAWIGSGTPGRRSLRASDGTWVALPDVSWAVPAGRCAVAAVVGGAGSILCMLYTLVLADYITGSLAPSSVLGGAGAALLAAAWAAFLTPRVGALPAIACVLALSALSLAPVPSALRALLPTALASVPIRGLPLLACALAAVGLLALTPRWPHADGGAGPER